MQQSKDLHDYLKEKQIIREVRTDMQEKKIIKADLSFDSLVSDVRVDTQRSKDTTEVSFKNTHRRISGFGTQKNWKKHPKIGLLVLARGNI